MVSNLGVGAPTRDWNINLKAQQMINSIEKERKHVSYTKLCSFFQTFFACFFLMEYWLIHLYNYLNIYYDCLAKGQEGSQRKSLTRTFCMGTFLSGRSVVPKLGAIARDMTRQEKHGKEQKLNESDSYAFFTADIFDLP